MSEKIAIIRNGMVSHRFCGELIERDLVAKNRVVVIGGGLLGLEAAKASRPLRSRWWGGAAGETATQESLDRRPCTCIG